MKGFVKIKDLDITLIRLIVRVNILDSEYVYNDLGLGVYSKEFLMVYTNLLNT